MNKESKIFFITVSLLFIISLYFAYDAKRLNIQQKDNLVKIAIVKNYGLTDLAIFSDASFLRNLSQSDFFSPFQENPSSFDMFPTASLITPPHLTF